MKTNGTRVVIIRGLLLVLLSLYFIVVFGQPSNIVSFNATKKVNHISLQWELGTSNNLSTIIIERKMSDTSFHSIAEFWINFDGNTERKFNFTDKIAKTGTARYRLKCIANDGKVQYSEVLSPGSEKVKTAAKANAVKTKALISRDKKLYADTVLSMQDNSEHLKYLLLVQLQERENNLL